jgi:hypothetical protein
MDLSTLLQFEAAIEGATCAILKKFGNVVPEFSDQKREHPAHEVKLHSVKEDGEHYFVRKAIQYPYGYIARIEISSVTQRFVNSDKQPIMMAGVRILRFNFLMLYNDATLPYHWITWMDEETTARQHITDGKFDRSVQEFAIKFQIREECLPEEV